MAASDMAHCVHVTCISGDIMKPPPKNDMMPTMQKSFPWYDVIMRIPKNHTQLNIFFRVLHSPACGGTLCTQK